MAWELPWTRRKREKEEREKKDRESEAFKLFEASKSVAHVASALKISATEARELNAQWKTMSTPDEATIQAQAFQRFDKDDSVVTVSAALKIDDAMARNLYKKYLEAKAEEEKLKADLAAKAPKRGPAARPFVPPYHVKKLVKNPQTGVKTKEEMFGNFPDPPEDMEWREFAQSCGDGTYTVIDHSGRPVKSVTVAGIGFSDPSEDETNPNFGKTGPGREDAEIDKEAEREIKEVERERKILVRQMELWSRRGNPAMAERIYRRLHPDEVAEEDAGNPSGAPGFGGPGGAPEAPKTEAELRKAMQKEMLDRWDFEDKLRERYGGDRDGPGKSKVERTLEAAKPLVERVLEDGVGPILAEWRADREARRGGQGPAVGELDTLVRRNRGKGPPEAPAQGTAWRKGRSIRGGPKPAALPGAAAPGQPAAPPALPPGTPPPKRKQRRIAGTQQYVEDDRAAAPEAPKEPSLADLPPLPAKPAAPSVEELEASLMDLPPAADSEVPVAEIDLGAGGSPAVPSLDLNSREAKWLVEKQLPLLHKTMSAHLAAVAEGDERVAGETAATAVALHDYKRMTGIGYMVIGAAGVKRIYETVQPGFDNFLAMIEPEVHAQALELDEMASALIEMGEAEFRKQWEPPAEIDKAEGLKRIKAYASLKPFWDDIQAKEEARQWMRDYFATLTAEIEEASLKRAPPVAPTPTSGPEAPKMIPTPTLLDTESTVVPSDGEAPK